MQAIFFDLDGTLVDSEPLWTAALCLTLEDKGCQLGKEEADQLVFGRSWLDIHAGLCQMFPKKCDDRSGMEKKIEKHFNSLKRAGGCSLPSSLALLVRLARDLPVAIVSGSGRKMIAEWIEELELTPHIDFYIGCEDYPTGKPDPRCYLMAAERLGLSPEKCLVFEDSNAGVTAAKAAGMHCVALRCHGARPQDLSAADWIVSDLAELAPDGLIRHPPQFRSQP